MLQDKDQATVGGARELDCQEAAAKACSMTSFRLYVCCIGINLIGLSRGESCWIRRLSSKGVLLPNQWPLLPRL